MECDVSEEVDLCERCHSNGTFTNGKLVVVCQFTSTARHSLFILTRFSRDPGRIPDHHPIHHQFEAITTADPLPYYADDDYAGDNHLGEFDYLG
jgi:hypothetical protein